MSKQEVIDVIVKELLGAYKTGWGRISRAEFHEILRAENLYDRLAPLIRGEFPEESIQTLLSQLYTITDCVARRGDTLENDPTIETREEIKRLWEQQSPMTAKEFPEERLRDLIADKDLWTDEGLLQQIKLLIYRQFWESQPHPKVGDNILEQDKPKGTCGTCGGTKKVKFCAQPDCTSPRHRKPCPDCDGTGRTPQSEESKEEGFVTASVTNDHPCQKCGGKGEVPVPRKSTNQFDKYWVTCHRCKGNGEERRTRGERRGGGEHLCRFAWPDRVAGGDFYNGFLWNDGNYPNRRILPERRKAVSGEGQEARTAPHSRR